MRLRLLLAAVLLVGFARVQARTSPGNQAAEKARIDRLVGLAKVWGAVKYFHPHLGYREIDWDKALVEAIPKVNAARSAREYEAAVNSMLAALGDRNTRAEIAAENEPVNAQSAKKDEKEPIRVEDGVLIINLVRTAETVAAQSNENALSEMLAKAEQLLPQARAVIIDGRGTTEPTGIVEYNQIMFLRGLISQMLDSTIPLGVPRYRMHSGYVSQEASGSGGYYSAFVNRAPATIAGRNKTKTPPVAVIVNDKTLAASNIFSGLQAARRAHIIQDGEAPLAAGTAEYVVKLPDGVSVRMRTTELVNPDGSIGFQPDLVVTTHAASGATDEAMKAALEGIRDNVLSRPLNRTSANAAAAPVAQVEKRYAEMTFPAAEYRLLALFRLWNVVNYFFPYKHLIDESWDDVLPRYVPKFEANRDAFEYQSTVRELVAEMQDSHAHAGNTNEFNARWGTFFPPVKVVSIEDRTIVAELLGEEGKKVTGLRAGDEVVAIDGRPVASILGDRARFTAASTPQALRRSLHWRLLSGAQDSKARLTVRDGGGERQVEVERKLAQPQYFELLFQDPRKNLPTFGVLPGTGFGYVDLEELTPADVDKMFEAIKETPATIFDMRGYPNGTAWSIAPRLTERTNVVGALFFRPYHEAIDLGAGSDYAGGTRFTFTPHLPERRGDVYKGKVVMLIDENAQSQSEYTGMFFAAATETTFVGTPTAGANGDITYTVLPGNLTVGFTGQDVRHADGRQLQRVGIQPTVRAEPTVRGFRAGRDEVLEAALEFLRSNKRKK